MYANPKRPFELTPVQIQELWFLPALTVAVFLRRRIGVRLVRPVLILRAFIAIQLFALLMPPSPGNGLDRIAIQGFSWGFALVALVQYGCSWHAFRRGDRLHSYAGGISQFRYSRVPRLFWKNRRIYRVLEPIVVLIAAGYAGIFCPVLAWWLVVASISLAVFEQCRYHAALDRALDLGDGLCEAEVQQETVEFFAASPSRSQRSQHVSLTVGIPTGIGPDIEAKIVQRRQKVEAEL